MNTDFIKMYLVDFYVVNSDESLYRFIEEVMEEDEGFIDELRDKYGQDVTFVVSGAKFDKVVKDDMVRMLFTYDIDYS